MRLVGKSRPNGDVGQRDVPATQLLSRPARHLLQAKSLRARSISEPEPATDRFRRKSMVHGPVAHRFSGISRQIARQKIGPVGRLAVRSELLAENPFPFGEVALASPDERVEVSDTAESGRQI